MACSKSSSDACSSCVLTRSVAAFPAPWITTSVVVNVQAVDGVMAEAVTSCVHFYGCVYDSRTLAVLEQVNRDNAVVS